MPNDMKRSKVSVILNRDEYERFDEYCSVKGYKKSTLIARLIRDHLDREGFRVQRPLPFVEGATDEVGR